MAQVFRFDGWVKSAQGAAVPGSQVYVCLQPANTSAAPPTPLASTFSDVNGLVPIVQPMITDGFGHYDCYVAAGRYTIVVALGGTIQQTYEDQVPMGSSVPGTDSTPVLQVNGVNNVDQGTLNLKNSSSVTWLDNGDGSVSAASSGGGGIELQVDGVDNADQTLLNLISNDSGTWVDDGAGAVEFQSFNTYDSVGDPGGPTGSDNHSVSGTVGLTGTQTLTINLSGNAQYSGPGQYIVLVTALANGSDTVSGIVVNRVSGAQFTIKATSTGTNTLMWLCMTAV